MPPEGRRPAPPRKHDLRHPEEPKAAKDPKNLKILRFAQDDVWGRQDNVVGRQADMRDVILTQETLHRLCHHHEAGYHVADERNGSNDADVGQLRHGIVDVVDLTG